MESGGTICGDSNDTQQQFTSSATALTTYFTDTFGAAPEQFRSSTGAVPEQSQIDRCTPLAFWGVFSNVHITIKWVPIGTRNMKLYHAKNKLNFAQQNLVHINRGYAICVWYPPYKIPI